MMKIQSKAKPALSSFFALTLAMALVPVAGGATAYAEEGGASGADDASGAAQVAAADATNEGAQVAETQQSQGADAVDAALQKEEGTVVILPSKEEMEESLAAAEALVADDAGISTFSIGADTLAAKSVDVQFFSGVDRIETSVLEAKAAFPASEYAIIAGSESWPDALTASGLAGAYKCPIMLTATSSLSDEVKQALKDMGVKHVFVLGDKYSVSDAAAKSIEDAIGEKVVRLSGDDRYETQMAIYNYGLKNNLWKGDLAVVANGENNHFADALSASPGAYAKVAPVFLVNGSGALSDAQSAAIETGVQKGLFTKVAVVGDGYSVSNATQTYLNSVCPNGENGVKRLGGDDRYQTSALIAEWMVGQGFLAWDNAAIATGKLAYDALGGGAAQGQAGSVLLLASSEGTAATDMLIKNKDAVTTSIRFYGGLNSVSGATRSYVAAGLGLTQTTSTPYSITFDNMVNYEVTQYAKGGISVTREALATNIDPANVTAGSSAFYQYAKIGEGYSGLFAAWELDEYIDQVVKSQEERTGKTSKLRGMGQAIIDAAKKYDINEVYLLCHAGLESGWGCSTLSQGAVKGYEGYYNFFGIGAYDSDPNNAGAAYAKNKGWNTPAKAIDGAGAFLSKGYIHDPSFEQDTLYNMKWDLFNAMNGNDAHYEYATDVEWAKSIGSTMSSLYLWFGIKQPASGLTFDIPQYQ